MDQQYSKIMVAVDGSNEAELAFKSSKRRKTKPSRIITCSCH